MSYDKLSILLWKNWTLQRRRPVSGFIQIVFPVLVVVIVTWARNQFGQQFGVLRDIQQDNITFSDLSACTFETRSLTKVFFSPNNDAYMRLIQMSFEGFEIKGFQNEGELWNEMFDQQEQIASVVLESDSEVSDTLPKAIRHSIESRYYNELCNLHLQHVIEWGFIKAFSDENLRDVTVRNFPYESEFQQLFTVLMMYILPFFLVFSMFATVAQVIKGVASERESKMKELMKIMGLSSTLHWTSWFLKCLLMSYISYTMVTVFLCIPIIGSAAVFQHSNFFLILLFFFIYCIGVITFCFMVSTIFTKASVASNVGVMLFFSTYVPYYVYGGNFESLNHFVKWMFCLPINTALGKGVSMALNMELNKQGITFANLFTQIEGFGFTFFEILMVMLVASVIHLLIMNYLEMVFPGDVGVPKPWHFPFTCCFGASDKTNDIIADSGNVFVSSGNMEEEPQHLSANVRITGLSKSFGSFKAVDNLHLNIFEDQITVLLAHNGGGKTTTMNMLIGMLPPTSGTAFINGHDITTNIADARKSLGICPQHNIVFADLTVSEHIIFFCRLKGMKSGKEIDREVEKYVHAMDFIDKKNARSKTLSGGQKRKLSIANALCGGSTFVVLDEPTSGLDVNARRKLWDLLIGEKRGRTILLSTHYMDEADVLGDRIAIMNEGRLKTVGTSFFLKKKFGSGYRLIIVKRPRCDANAILDVLRQHAPDATIEADEQREAIFTLSEEYLSAFDRIFKRLEEESNLLGIESLGCSLTTLEEVFLKVGVETHVPNSNETTVTFNDLLSFSKVSALTLMMNQTYAMALKKFHFTRRNYASYIMLALLTAWLTFVFLAAPVAVETNFSSLELTTLIHTDNTEMSMITTYKSLFNESSATVTGDDIDTFLFRNFMQNNLRFEIGMSFLENDNAASVYFNFYSYIRAVNVALNYYHRAILKKLTSPEHDIQLRYNPYGNSPNGSPPPPPPLLDETESGDSDEVSRNVWEDILVYILFFLLLIYWPSIQITLKIKERVTKAKLLQFISGVNKLIFTLVSLVLDIAITLSIMFIIYGIIVAINRPGFNTLDEAALYLTIFTFYVINFIPFIYLMSFVFVKHSTGETMMQLIPFAFAIIYVGYAILANTIPSNVAHVFASIIYWIAIFFAPFSIIDCFVKILDAALFGGEIWKFGEKGLFLNFTLMAVGGAIFLSIVLLKDYLVFMWIRYKVFNRSRDLPSTGVRVDDDVLNEEQRVRSKTAAEIADSNLVMRGLSKFYGNHPAVNNLHVGIEKAECFGLLGVNGSGKTSVFKMLTGDTIISKGGAWVHGNSLINQVAQVYKKIGYCPQFDALLPELSGRETLKIFCLLRGIPRSKINAVIETFAVELDFYKHLDKKVEQFSGGNRRKLSTTLALLGNLSLVFLDECSSGIDAKATRQLWNIINKTKNAGKSIVLTSHSMQECETLCTKLAIMVDGEFQCLGSIQHLKNKFAKGFILKIMLGRREDEAHYEAVRSRIVMKFPEAELKENFMGLLTFHINTPTLKWSEVFAELALMKDELGISDYTLTQSSLESVFLFFSKQSKRKND